MRTYRHHIYFPGSSAFPGELGAAGLAGGSPCLRHPNRYRVSDHTGHIVSAGQRELLPSRQHVPQCSVPQQAVLQLSRAGYLATAEETLLVASRLYPDYKPNIQH
jgi:hypothetical protein